MTPHSSQCRGRHFSTFLRACLTVTLTVLTLLGCNSSDLEDSAKREMKPAAAELLEVWKSGIQEAAIDLFLKTDWTSATLFPEESVLRFTEKEYIKQANQTTLGQELITASGQLKQLARAVADEGIRLGATGDLEAAQAHFQALRSCGQALNQEHYTKLLQLVGQAFTMMAEKCEAHIAQFSEHQLE